MLLHRLLLGRFMTWFDWLGPITVIAIGVIVVWLMMVGLTNPQR
jgi:hypothetical protein